MGAVISLMMTAQRTGRGRGPGCILILDTHPLFGRILFPALHDEGMDVHEVGVGPQPTMVAAVTRHGAGVVLLDLALDRDRSGQRVHAGPLVAALTANGSPVLGVGGRGDESAAARAVAAGAVGVLSKELPLADLVNAMVRAGRGVPVSGTARHEVRTCSTDFPSIADATADRRRYRHAMPRPSPDDDRAPRPRRG